MNLPEVCIFSRFAPIPAAVDDVAISQSQLLSDNCGRRDLNSTPQER